VVLKKII